MDPTTIDAGLTLLDNQIMDKDNNPSGKVDDLEFSIPEDGGPPYVSAILTGPGALAPRLRKLGRSLLTEVHAHIRPRHRDGPARIAFGVVKGVGSQIDVELPRAELDVGSFEIWIGEKIISKIPGAAHEAE
jgi:hypothetical protein